MKAVVIYESLTGNTRKAASLIAARLAAAGVEVLDVAPTWSVDHGKLQEADVVVIGTWVKGHFVVGMRPAAEGKLGRLPAIAGKKAVVYCTYAINPGTTLERMTRIVEGLGAEVIGGMAINRRKLEAGADEFVARLLGAMAR